MRREKGETMVVRFGTLRKLPAREKRLVLKAIWLLWQVRLSTWVNSVWALETYHRHKVQRESIHHAPVYQLIWAVQTAARFVAGTTSLVEALAAKTLLAHYGYDSRLHVGVVRKGRELEAHAWLTQAGEVVIGEVDELVTYRPFSSVKGQRNKLVWRSAKS
jgi:hypothetical protein